MNLQKDYLEELVMSLNPGGENENENEEEEEGSDDGNEITIS